VPATTTFVSKPRHLRIVVQTAGVPMAEKGTGLVVGKTAGAAIEFNRQQYIATDAEAARLGFGSQQELVEWLRSRQTFDREFYELGKDPEQQLPLTQELLDKITYAAIRGQKDKVREILQAEQASHQRPEVIRTAEIALGELTDGKEGRMPPGRRPGQPQAA
jgi:hypothetical protein